MRRLSQREEQILVPLSEGHPNKAIAAKLGISIETAGTQLKYLYDKMHVTSRTEAVVRYMASKSGRGVPDGTTGR